MASSSHDMNLIIRAKDQASGIINKTLGDWKTAVTGVGAAYLSMKGAVATVEALIMPGMEAEKIWNDVAASIERHGYSVERNLPIIRQFGSSLQNITGISDELSGKAIQRLLDSNMRLGDTFASVKAAADLAAAKDMDLMAATELLAKASMGVTETLKRYGIVIADNIPKSEKYQAVLDQINQRFGGAAAAQMEASLGKAHRLGEQISDLSEQMYDAFLSPVISSGISMLSGVVGALSAKMTELFPPTRNMREELDNSLQYIRAASDHYQELTIDVNRLTQSFESGKMSADEFRKELAQMLEKILAPIPEEKIRGFRAATEAEIEAAYRASKEKQAIMDKDFAFFLDQQYKMAEAYNTAQQSLYDKFVKWQEMMSKGKQMASAEDIAYINTLSDAWFQQQELYSTMAKDRVNVHLAMIEEIEMVDEAYFEAISDMRFRELDKITKKELEKVRATERTKLNFSEAAARGMYAAFGTASNAIIGQMTFLQKTSGGIFGAMARDFMKYFIEAALDALAKVFVVKALKILGGMFDNPVNDAMAAKQGADFARYFTKGVIQGLQNIGNIMALNVPSNLPQLAYAGGGTSYTNISLTFNNTQVDSRFVRDEIIPAIEQAVTYGQSKIVTRNENLTGRRDVQFR